MYAKLTADADHTASRAEVRERLRNLPAILIAFILIFALGSFLTFTPEGVGIALKIVFTVFVLPSILICKLFS